ncbi:MAG: hypothetical protein A3I88_02515 [Candidatus Portnoybacteria bacterium RIFCSPLOWO2_12_FULL_39_9]|uniref:Polysaccharide biosynthesis protein C-terminal domain-containing protein n=1 Tax=Candidatus Portnoybacteria bacterium RIFCSPHIGHO2_12_FULL_38_9 TaxID=1801997 RepID=A0A1G2FH45_9BACT|nr:MAG: hypothetical protein A3H00_01295 [Candidatus Portnoybacteria bacterium RBG_13_40_8]OGZ35737.1 MAG: hypothetical protein A2646_02870 [Candidatus Portnoybacteria bacterium RIFCSPHIGHO2_02_FULL_39_12]OGZ37112.1 MAG: hypothetical protein A3J64_01195 [Candidatus Portnoybacteria bacterium RIFCSPHIGHO2_12_FULL_38_9]OGZ39481.1 MAG: hypothetical protein A3F21_03210 [Candidatus Portnoybacteria bacterium RIFCSPLOWO2_01_FULL_38_39]OGZ39709.1 MAG: hypothetical protein A3I88_02515 [Candidatus Portnoy
MPKIQELTASFIYKLQNYFKIDLLYLVKGGSYLMLGKAVNLTSAFVVALAWANWINPEIYGNYQYILSLTAIISVFSLPELETAVVQAVARNLEGSFMRGFKTQLKWGILASLASLTAAGYYYWLKDNVLLALCFLVVAAFLPLFNASLIYASFLSGKKLFNFQVKYDSLTQVAAASIMILTLFSVKHFLSNAPNFIVLLLIIFIYYLSRTLLRLFFLIKTKRKFNPNSQEEAETVSYGKHLTLTGFIGTLSEYLDKILLFHYLGAIELAVYSFAVLVPKQIRVVIDHIAVLSLPKLSIRSREELKKTFIKKIYYLTALISVLVIFYIIIAPWVYKILFPKYLTAIPYSQLYALSVIPVSFSMISEIFKAKMVIKEIYQIRIIGPLVKIGLSVVLIPLYGIWGAILSALFARTFNVFLYLFLFRKV